MKIMVKATNMALTAAIKSYVNDKIGLASALLTPTQDAAAQARVEVGRPSRHHHQGDVHLAEVNLTVGKKLFRAEVLHNDLYIAINQSRDELERQLRKYKTKNVAARRKVPHRP